MIPARGHREESGLTLVELLVTISIMSVAFIAILSGIATFHKVTVVQRATADLDAGIRSFSEQLAAAPYVDCATVSSYNSVPAPAGLTAALTEIRYWDGTPGGSNFDATCPGTDRGAQRLTFTLTRTANGQSAALTIAKRKP